MKLFSCFYILQTVNSEVNRKTLFTHRFTTYVPDLFFVFCFATSLFIGQCFDKILTVLIFCWGHSLTAAVVFATSALLPFVFLFELEKNHEKCLPGYTINSWCSVILILLGLGPFLICGKALRNSFQNQNDLNMSRKRHSFPVFHIKDEDMSYMKSYFIVTLAIKIIPQFYIVNILVTKRYLIGILAILGQVSLMVNVVLFSLTMAMTFPLRSSPRVYTTSFCIPFNAFCKFMATICGCGINLVISTVLFASIGYYALLVQAIKSLLWVWPSWWVLKTQPYVFSEISFSLLLFFLTLIFSFIYIHPFEGKGKLIYYIFYLLKFCSEIFCIYFFTEANNEIVSIYFTLKAVMIGYLSCYGLVNIFHKYKLSKFGYEVELQVKEEENEKTNSTEGKNLEANIDDLSYEKSGTEVGDISKHEDLQALATEGKSRVQKSVKIDEEAGSSKD